MQEQDNIVFLRNLKWAKPCKICKLAIPAGSQCWWFKSETQYAHIDCWRKDNLKKLNANSGKAQEFPKERQASPPVSPSSKVSLRMKKAKELIQKESPEIIDTDGYPYVFQEVLHQLYGEEWHQ